LSNTGNVSSGLNAQEESWVKDALTALSVHHDMEPQHYLSHLLNREATREIPNWRWMRLKITSGRVVDAADDLTEEGQGFTLSELLDYMGVGSENLKTRGRAPLGRMLENNGFRYKACRINGRQRWLWVRK